MLQHPHPSPAARPQPPRRCGSACRALLLLCLPVLLGLTCCASLPTIVPDLARHSGAPVQLQGARGPLTAPQSRAILDGLRARGQDTDIFARHLALEEAIVGSPLTTGNAVQLLQDGPATYRAMLAAIAAAREHINMETYILDDDEVGRHFAAALIAKQREGVQVNLLRDSAGTIGTPAAFFQQLSDAGVRVLEFNPLNPLAARRGWELNQRDHRKLLVVDGRVAFLGGINISSVYSGGSFGKKPRPQARADSAPTWRDTDLQLRGPAVTELQKLFLANWAAQQGEPLRDRDYLPTPQSAGRQVVRIIGSSPEEAFSLIYATLLSAIGSAETTVHLTNAYFVPDPQLLAALEAAAARGVDVRLILPGQSDSWLVFHAGRGYYERLLRAGVKIFERRGAILHSKTALIDGVWATVGSTNLDWRSFLHNHELNAVMLGTEFGLQLQAMFTRDEAASEAITLTQWQRRSPALRLKEWFARLWAYWL
ncbi:cardiolipin synthase [Roseateles sp. DAIF2]|uniref:cardiolipin synthase n=1 Tax=Roseateles sp. DAIF2 TaxID=2714952 RepID=UPI0018A24C86|nr:cardiolipin synthase [Roseateles sp. DAIF2]QPF75969.1 cardiolipin synthase [Roseateles sp. DAIF2]